MKGTTASNRYAKALLELAVEQNKLDQVAGDMNYLLEASKESLEFQTFLDSPVINSEKKVAIFNELFGQFEEVSLKFVQLIAKNGRESYLPTIAQSFDQQVKEFKGIVPVTIITASPMDNELKNTILGKIDKSVTGTLEIKEIVDESIIGGFVVRMGDTQIDASVSSQFNKLKQRLTR